MSIYERLKTIRLLGNTIPLVSLTFISFILVLVFLSITYEQYLKELEAIVVMGEEESDKMELNSVLMELARGRTRLTAQIIDTEDLFEQDELNLKLEADAGRFAGIRQELLGLNLSDKEIGILKMHETIVPVILPAQRKAVELAMSDDEDGIRQAKKILYEVVYPGQGRMIGTFGMLISHEHENIAELTMQARQSTIRMKENSRLFVSTVLLAIAFIAFIVIRRIRIIQNNLIHSYEVMESKVEVRTEQLRLARDELQHYIDIVDKYVIASHTDSNGVISYASKAFCRISKYQEDELLGSPHSIVRHPDMPKSFYKEMWSVLKQGKSWSGEIKNRTKDGSVYWVDANIEPKFNDGHEIVGYTSIRQDVTDKKHIEELSVTDCLTQLYNRMELDNVLSYEIGRANRYENELSVILFDVDKFKKINDEFGHPVGDTVLVAIADITRETIRNADIAGRWGGEEFMVICPDTNIEGVENLADKIRQNIVASAFPNARRISASFGVACYKKDEGEVSVLKRVDLALYRAKKNGRNQVVAA